MTEGPLIIDDPPPRPPMSIRAAVAARRALDALDDIRRRARFMPRRNTPKAQRPRVPLAPPPPLSDPVATLGHPPRPRKARRG